MEILLTILITTAINLVIIALIAKHLEDLLLRSFKDKDKLDNEIVKHINNIYDIITHNNLIKPKKGSSDKNDKRTKSYNK